MSNPLSNPSPVRSASQMLHTALHAGSGNPNIATVKVASISTNMTPSTPIVNTTPSAASYKFADLRKRQQIFIDGLINAGYSGKTTTRRAVVATAASLGYPDSFPWPSWLTADMDRRLARGVFNLPELAERVTERGTAKTLPNGYMLDPSTAGTMCATPERIGNMGNSPSA